MLREPDPVISLSALEGFARAVAQIGGRGLDTALLGALNGLAQVDQLAALTVGRRAAPRALLVASRRDVSAARSFTRDYVDGWHVDDPLLAELRSRNWTKGVMLRRHDPEKLPSDAYERRFFSAAGMVDKVALLWWSGDSGCYVNCYRTTRSGRYSEREVAALRGGANLVAAIIDGHAARMAFEAEDDPRLAPARRAARLVSLLGAGLTPREQAVLALVIQGVSTQGVAMKLGIKASSVITLRKRAYARLGVSTLTELTALCIAAGAP